MMSVIKGCAIAISMYSKIPVPQFEWDEKSMRYALGFFPLVGVFIGALQLVLYCFVYKRGFIGGGLYAAAATALPLVVTGGIHMDGYCDTIDALSSMQTRERRLEILKDSHSGAFAVIWTGVYLILCFGMWTETDAFGTVCMISLGYLASRSLSGLAALFFPCANKKGSLAAFTSPAQKGVVCALLAVTLAAACVLQALLFPVRAVVMLVCEAAFMSYYYRCQKRISAASQAILRDGFCNATSCLCFWLRCCDDTL